MVVAKKALLEYTSYYSSTNSMTYMTQNTDSICVSIDYPLCHHFCINLFFLQKPPSKRITFELVRLCQNVTSMNNRICAARSPLSSP